MNLPIIETNHVYKSYQNGLTKVLSDINFSLFEGQCVALTGVSGSGKSTLLHLLSGLEEATQGEIKINGQLIDSMSESQKSQLRNQFLGFVYQFHHLMKDFTILENVAIPLLVRRTKKIHALEKSEQLLKKVGLADKVHLKPAALSGGQKQRVAVARALVGNPKCIFADEPTGNLDRENADNIFSLLINLCEENKSSVIFTTHDKKLVGQAHRVYQIEQGQLKEQ